MPDEETPDRVEVSGSLTKDEWERAFSGERDYTRGQIAIVLARIEVERERSKGQHLVTVERLNGIDRATVVLNEIVTNVPTDLQQATIEILRLMDERDRMVQARFDANEKLSQTESALNQTALAAALQAAKEAAAVSATALETRITSQSFTTDRTIEKNAELSAQAIGALGARVTQQGDLIIRVERQLAELQASKIAVGEQKHDTRGQAGVVQGYIGMVFGLIAIITTIVIAIVLRA
jgi:hypothetical protein